MVESVDAGCMGHINKNDWCAINKAPGRNRSRQCIPYGSVRTARAHAALLVTDGFLFRRVLPRQRGIQKQSHTNGLQQRCAENVPSLTGSRGWHQVPSGSFNPKGIFAQSWRVSLISCGERKYSTAEAKGTFAFIAEAAEIEDPR